MANINDQIRVVNFYGQDIHTFLHEGKPHVVARTVCDGMGLAWTAQFNKFHKNWDKYRCQEVKATAGDGKVRKTIAIPLTHLNSWLLSIYPNKVPNPDLRANLLKYQEESAQVLYAYWSNKQASSVDVGHARKEIWQSGVQDINLMDTVTKFLEYSRRQGSLKTFWHYSEKVTSPYLGITVVLGNVSSQMELYEALSDSSAEILCSIESAVQESMKEGMAAGLPYAIISRRAVAGIRNILQAARTRQPGQLSLSLSGQ